jgi:hypothetical protein
MRIVIETSEGETSTFDIDQHDTIFSLKQMIWTTELIPIDNIRLKYLETDLENHRLLSEYNISPNDHIKLELRLLKDKIRIYVNICDSNMFRIYVGRNETLYSIKRLISDKINIPFECLCFDAIDQDSYGKQKITDIEPLLGKIMIYFHLQTRDVMQVLIKNIYSNKLTVIVVDPTEKVSLLKQKIFNKELFPPERQRLVYAGKLLDDNKTLDECLVHSGSQIMLVLKQQS